MRSAYLKILVAVCVIVVALFITVLWVRDRALENELTLYGNVDVRLVDIGFRVAGRVNQLFFEEGDLVRKGQLLCVLDKTPYDAELKRAESSVRAAMANLNLAEILLKRRQELIGIGGVSQEDLDHARASRDQLLADLQLAQANVTVSQDNLNYTEVYAPTDGIILSRVREPGTVVTLSDPVYSLSVLSPVWVRAFVSEPDLGKIYYGMPAEIVTDTKGAPTYKAHLTQSESPSCRNRF